MRLVVRILSTATNLFAGSDEDDRKRRQPEDEFAEFLLDAESRHSTHSQYDPRVSDRRFQIHPGQHQRLGGVGGSSQASFRDALSGSEWFTTYRDAIEAQYEGDLEKFILDLGDASQISATICHNFSPVELIGLRELMLKRDIKKIDDYEVSGAKIMELKTGNRRRFSRNVALIYTGKGYQ